MKKFIFILTAALVISSAAACRPKQAAAPAGADIQEQAVDAAHNSRNSLNWEGVYTGTLPAASSPGITMSVTLKTNETYEMTFSYIDREGVFNEKGSFQWDDAGSVIILDNLEGQPARYKVGENTITQLDMEGNLITGDMAGLYILRKTP